MVKFGLQKCRDVFTFVVERPIEQIDGMLSEVGVSVQTERWRKSYRMQVLVQTKNLLREFPISVCLDLEPRVTVIHEPDAVISSAGNPFPETNGSLMSARDALHGSL